PRRCWPGRRSPHRTRCWMWDAGWPSPRSRSPAAALQGSGGVAEEINGGTLEQTHLSPARPSLLAAGRLGALATEGLIPAVLLPAAFWAGFAWSPAALLPAAL